jgi:hypothetical protein
MVTLLTDGTHLAFLPTRSYTATLQHGVFMRSLVVVRVNDRADRRV